MTKTWWEAPMGGSVLSFLKAEWKVSDTTQAQPTEPLVLFSKGNLLIQVWLMILNDNKKLI
jgi:hypothetical protein